MSNVLIGTPIFSDVGNTYTPVLSGGSWLAALPLANLQTRDLSDVARSTDAAYASTRIIASLGFSAPIRVIAFPKHNLSLVAKLRARAFSALPLFALRDFNITDWPTIANTPTHVADSYNSNGFKLAKIGDDNAVSYEYFQKTITYTTDGTKSITFKVKKDTGQQTLIAIVDTTVGPARLNCIVDWAGAVPTVSVSGGATHAEVALVDGVYEVTVTFIGVLAASVNVARIYPAQNGPTDTGTVYLGDMTFYDAAAPTRQYDSNWVAAYDAAVTQEEINALFMNFGWVVCPASGTNAAYVIADADDTTNADGYVQLGRLIVAGGYQPSINMEYGVKLGFETESTRKKSEGGSGVYRKKPVGRTMQFVVNHLPEAEALSYAYKLQMRNNLTEQQYVVFDPADVPALMQMRSFLAVPRELGVLDFPYFNYAGIAYSFAEEL